jgi:DNA-binding MarR family transcriptional regulator
MSSLSRHVNRERGSFTSVFDSLERLGFVERHPDREDRRVVNTELTKEGRQYMDRARRCFLEHLDRKLDRLSSSEKADFHEAMITIHRIAEKISEEKK